MNAIIERPDREKQNYGYSSIAPRSGE